MAPGEGRRQHENDPLAALEDDMFTLSIEHGITDFLTWKAAFDRFGEARAQAGVSAERIRRPLNEPRHLLIELDFETKEAAESFRQFLMTVVWANPEASPALAGAPTARVLEPAAQHQT
jgi:hypothetical protein